MTTTPDPTPSPAPGAQVDPSKVPLSQIIRGLTTGQAWKLGATLVAIALSAAAAGKWVESWQREKAIAAATAPKDDAIEGFSRKVEQLEAAVAATAGENENLKVRLADAKRFIAFADKYITYLSSGEDPARSIFADHVCMLYRQSQQADVGLTMNTTTVFETLGNARAPGSRDALVAMGLNPALVDEIIELQTIGIGRSLPNISSTVGYSVEPSVTRVSPINVNPGQRSIPANDPRAQNIATDVMKRLSGESGQLVKVVTFHLEGRDYSYTMPPEIAGLVHKNPDCRVH